MSSMYSGPVVVFQMQMAPLADAAAAREPPKERATCSTSDQRTLGGRSKGLGKTNELERLEGGGTITPGFGFEDQATHAFLIWVHGTLYVRVLYICLYRKHRINVLGVKIPGTPASDPSSSSCRRGTSGSCRGSATTWEKREKKKVGKTGKI